MEAGMKVGKIVTVGAAALAACGVLGMASAAARAGSAPDPAWTKQAPATRPPGRDGAAMAYDAATGTVVMVGGVHDRFDGGTWIWDGTTWTKQALAVQPSARADAAMAYDAATGTAVLFGGYNGHGHVLADTWTWNGTTWTKQALAVHPPAQDGAAMAYDAATGTVVLFGRPGPHGNERFGDTWTWDGTTWTKQHPATRPAARTDTVMAYDAATGTVLLFGGYGLHANERFGDTWTWDGTTWTRQHPATHPTARNDSVMAYDVATGTVVLFSGVGRDVYNDTWTWDGTTWTEQAPAVSPPARAGAAMAYDAATGTAVLFGGSTGSLFFHDTWTWG
jgi:hypothetical protein